MSNYSVLEHAPGETEKHVTHQVEIWNTLKTSLSAIATPW
jgi:hypothetical protein